MTRNQIIKRFAASARPEDIRHNKREIIIPLYARVTPQIYNDKK